MTTHLAMLIALAFEPMRRVALKLSIRPLIGMESSVMSERFVGLGATPAAYEEFMKLKNSCRIVSANFTLLRNNSGFSAPERANLYGSVVRE